MTADERLHLDTLALHAGADPDPATGAVVPPISLATTFAQPSPGVHRGWEYARVSNPNRDQLEAAVAALEGGQHGLAFASGCAALATVLQTLRPGERVVASADIYGGTYRILEQVIAPTGVELAWVDLGGDAEAMRARLDAAIDAKTRMVVAESPTNPLLRLVDLEAIASVTRARDVTLVVDNTFATPMLQRPLTLGADVVVHSTTKFINGHSDVLGGVVVTDDAAMAERLRFFQKAVGAVPSPFDCALTMRGIKTLPVRMERHGQNALALAEWLEGRGGVEAVHHPGLASHPQHALAKRQMRGFGAMVAVEVAGGADGAKRFLERLKLFTLAESLGGVESLVAYPAMMSHAAMPAEVRRERGIVDGLVRVSVGLEHVDDLRRDLDQALG